MKNLQITLVVISLSFLGFSCQSPKSEQAPPILQDKLKAIESVQLKDLTDIEPIDVEDATEEISTQAMDANSTTTEVYITLEAVRAATLANNLALQVALVEPSLAQTSLDEQRAKFESAFYGEADFRRAEGVGSSAVTKTQTYEAGIAKPLPTGGSLSVGVPIYDVDSTSSNGVAEAKLSVAYYQSLLRGAGTSINTQSIQVAQLSRHIMDARTKLRAIQYLAQADRTYWRVYAARKELEVRQEQYRRAQDQLRNAEKMVDAGAAARIEIIRADAGLAGRLERLIQAETALEQWERNLRRLMNQFDIPTDQRISYIPESHPHPQGWTLDHERLISHALENRIDLIALEQQLIIDDLDIQWAQNQRLPDLGFNTRFNTRNQGDAWVDSYHRFKHKQYNDWSVGLSATIPLGNQAAEARLRRAKLARIQDRLQHDDMKQLIRVEVEESISALESGWRRILAANQGVIAADRDFRVEQSQFQLGRRNSTDVLLAASRLGEAELSRIRAYADYEIAQIYLAQATGTLLGLGRVEIKPVQLSSKEL